jgi:large subunit ribosomal protein L24
MIVMRKKFSRQWVKSKQPRKQRKYRANAPKHIQRKLRSAHLSKKLKEKYKKRSLPLRKGDGVKILRGQYKGKTTKVSGFRSIKVLTEDVKIKKANQQEVAIPIDPSNLIITELNMEDRKRLRKRSDKDEKS